jgi:cbb3-type cytochrome oxidase subunit 3
MTTMWGRLDLVQKLVLVAIPLGLLHHADHVGRADHSAWPFRPEVGPFTFTLLIYPVLLLAFRARGRHGVRVASLGVVSLFTLLAHTLIEPPQQIYGTWANNLSTPAPLYSVDPKHMHNLFDVEWPLLGVLAMLLTILLTMLLLVVWAVAIRDAQRR